MNWLWAPLGSPTLMLWFVQHFLVHGIWGPRKWLVNHGSKMARVAEASRVAGTTELIEEMEFKATVP